MSYTHKNPCLMCLYAHGEEEISPVGWKGQRYFQVLKGKPISCTPLKAGCTIGLKVSVQNRFKAGLAVIKKVL